MKKNIKTLIGLLTVVALVAAGYYLTIVNSTGTEGIRYIEPTQTYTSFMQLLQDPALKGKTVYVDVWRTSCGPCLEEFKTMPALKKHFKGFHDKLVFLYLACDRSAPGEKFRWKRMVENKNLEGHHYFMSKPYFEAMWKEVVKDTSITPRFPQYFIVNSQGQVINYDSPRPSDPKVYATLEQTLTSNSLHNE